MCNTNKHNTANRKHKRKLERLCSTSKQKFNKTDIFRNTYFKLLKPPANVEKGLFVGEVEQEQKPHRLTIEGGSQTTKSTASVSKG